MSNYFENLLGEFILRAGSLEKPAVYLALTSGVPTDAHTGATIPELASAGSYARLAASGTAFWDALSDGATSNTSEAAFAAATADWGIVSGVVFLDSSTIGAGNVLFHGTLTTPRTVLNGDTFKFNANNLDIQFL